MQISKELAEFLASPVMIIIGTNDDRGRSEIARGVGASVDVKSGVIDLVLSQWQWPGTLEHLRGNGRIAITFARPADYVSFQVKGHATLHAADVDDIKRSELYMDAVADVLTGLGLERRHIASWLCQREPCVVRVRVAAVFVQTPGANAGQAISPSA